MYSIIFFKGYLYNYIQILNAFREIRSSIREKFLIKKTVTRNKRGDRNECIVAVKI